MKKHYTITHNLDTKDKLNSFLERLAEVLIDIARYGMDLNIGDCHILTSDNLMAQGNEPSSQTNYAKFKKGFKAFN